MTTVDSRALRRATTRLGLLAAVLLVAGLLPWLTAGPLGVRLVALPMLLAGLGVAAVALRVRRVVPAAPAPLVERGCDGCACGGGGCGTAG